MYFKHAGFLEIQPLFDRFNNFKLLLIPVVFRLYNYPLFFGFFLTGIRSVCLSGTLDIGPSSCVP
ncbi:hypothetical protein BD410DRAFT_8798 [Rickenella mellea]|uniref:Uncharacterized protein n=1 Tax=Rickenella mellea TaxID=50990 RepID=A0A4R5XDS3_9AGAM|nr:hypothetical protein BD410DRAFT_8798 [Rickenella mellea]